MKCCETCGQALPEYGAITADDDRGEVRFNGMAACGFTGKEYQLFRALLDARGRTLSKGQILDRLYDNPDDEPEQKIVDVFVCRLRRLIHPLGLRIGTSWGRGYFLDVPGLTPPANPADHAHDNALAAQ